MAEYDVVVIGGGPGGYIAAIRAAQLGLKAAVVEKDEVGGICLNWGCIPSKALLRNAEVVQLFREAGAWGIKADNLSFDMGAAIDRSRGVVERMVTGVKYLFKKNGITLYTGAAKLSDAHTVQVAGVNETISTKNIIVATGARSRDLPHLKFDGRTVLGSREALALKQQPKSVAIIGGGSIGCEFAYYYNAYGTDVTIIEMLPRLVPAEDEEVSAQLERSLKRQGIKVMTSASVDKLTQSGGKAQLTTSVGLVEAEKVLLGIGVLPNSDGLGLDTLGVSTERGFIKVDDRMATNAPGIYAIGDVTGKMMLAHVASAQGVVAVEVIAGKDPDPLDYKYLPRATYCQPQVASMGLTEKGAAEAGHTVQVGKFPFSANGKAVALNAVDGFVKIVSDSRTGQLLGAHLIGHDVTDMLAEFSVTKVLEGTTTEIGHTVHAHPTLSEAVMEAALGVTKESLSI